MIVFTVDVVLVLQFLRFLNYTVNYVDDKYMNIIPHFSPYQDLFDNYSSLKK
jgi:hypothetical protein